MNTTDLIQNWTIGMILISVWALFWLIDNNDDNKR